MIKRRSTFGKCALLLRALVLCAALAACSGSANSQSEANEQEGQIAPTAQQAQSPMILGAASNFSQGFSAARLDAALALPLAHFRDGMRWSDVEREAGQYRFIQEKTTYPARLAERGGSLILTISGENGLYDNGATPHSPEAIDAFARFVAELVKRYPAISAIEVGNEFNSANFVAGLVKDEGLARRGEHHLRLLRAIAREVRNVAPDMPILGGAAHSIPAGYLWPILDRAEPGLIDGLTIHPYSTPIDQFAKQIGVLRRHPAAARLPIYVTEFGSNREATAPGELVRAYAALSSLGVAELDWYPLNERGDGAVPLLRRDSSLTDTGRAFAFVQAKLASKIARDVSPDPFTFAHAFGADTLVLWGEPRTVRLNRADIAAFNAQGEALDPARLELSASAPLILIGQSALSLAQDIGLGCQSLLADTQYQFDFPPFTAVPSQRPGFASHLLLSGERLDWITMPGQQEQGVPWVPYLGVEGQRSMRLTHDNLLLAGAGQRNAELVHQVTLPQAGQYRLEITIAPQRRNNSSAILSASLGNEQLLRKEIAGPLQLKQEITARADEQLSIAIARASVGRVGVSYRLRLHDLTRCQ